MKSSVLFMPCLTLALLSLAPAASALGTFELRPGQYESQSIMTVNANVVKDDTGGFCITPETEPQSIEAILDKLTQDGDCDLNVTEATEGNFSADMRCNIGETAATLVGQINASYTNEDIFIMVDVDVDAGEQTFPARLETIMGRVGDCDTRQ